MSDTPQVEAAVAALEAALKEGAHVAAPAAAPAVVAEPVHGVVDHVAASSPAKHAAPAPVVHTPGKPSEAKDAANKPAEVIAKAPGV